MQSQPPYLRLSQFVDLEKQWLDARDAAELAHRICRSLGLLLEADAVAIGVAEPTGYRYLASEGDADAAFAGATSARMAQRARDEALPQLKSRGDKTDAVIPFDDAAGVNGCLHVRIDSPLARASEISFLRLVGSLVGLALGRLRAATSNGHTPSDEAGTAVNLEPVPAEVSPDVQDGGRETETSSPAYAALVAHDLRRPLSVLSGFAALLEDGSLGPLNDDQREAVAAVRRQSRALEGTVDTVLEVEHVVAGTDGAKRTTFPLAPLIRELRETVFVEADERIHWPRLEESWVLHSHRGLFARVLQNLIENALEHAPDGEVEVGCGLTPTALLVRVADRGPGLDPCQVAVLTEGRLPGKGAGAGALGLYAVHVYTRVLGLRVRAADRDGGGTVVTIEAHREGAG